MRRWSARMDLEERSGWVFSDFTWILCGLGYLHGLVLAFSFLTLFDQFHVARFLIPAWLTPPGNVGRSL